jgi:hypothetical protein
MAADLNNHHRDTRERILNHPSSGNMEWRQVLSLEAVGTTTAKDIDPQRIVVLSTARLSWRRLDWARSSRFSHPRGV